jgi:redox-sensitive bicupin YhaK (pirin superfamily)
MTEDPFLLTLRPVTHDLGGFKVHRTLPHRERTTVGPFIFFDQMGPATLPVGEGIDVRPHPHINLATVTYLFAGAIDHRDSLGTCQTIEPGAVILMTAGRRDHPFGAVAGGRARGGAAAFGDPDLAGAAERQGGIGSGVRACAGARAAGGGGGGARARVIMGSLWGATSPVTQHSATIYADIMLEPGGSIAVDAGADERALYVAEGSASLDGCRSRRPRFTCCGRGWRRRCARTRAGM